MREGSREEGAERDTVGGKEEVGRRRTRSQRRGEKRRIEKKGGRRKTDGEQEVGPYCFE